MFNVDQGYYSHTITIKFIAINRIKQFLMGKTCGAGARYSQSITLLSHYFDKTVQEYFCRVIFCCSTIPSKWCITL